MAIYSFVHGLLLWTVSLQILLFPLNIFMASLAHRIWRNNKPLLEEEEEDFWKRSFLSAGSIALLCIAAVFLDQVLCNASERLAGPIHFILYLLLLSGMIWMMMLFFAMEDFFAAFSLLVIYLYLPIFVLWPLNKLIGFWNPVLRYLTTWMPDPT